MPSILTQKVNDLTLPDNLNDTSADTVALILDNALHLLNAVGWGKNDYVALSDTGQITLCALGAVLAGAGLDVHEGWCEPGEAVEEAGRALTQALGEQAGWLDAATPPAGLSEFVEVAAFNDRPSCDFADIERIYKRALELVRG